MPTPANVLNINQTGLVKFDGVANFTGVTLTNHSVLVGATSNGITAVGPSATTNQVLLSKGAALDPAFSTATYPDTTTINQILYSSATNTISEITAANSSALVSSSAGVPSWTAGTTNSVLIGTTGATPSFSTTSTTYFTAISFDAGTNLLNVYKESVSYTPTISGSTGAGTIAYTTQVGRYTQIGKRIFLDVFIEYTNTTSATGNLQVSLPTTAATITNVRWNGVCSFDNINLPTYTGGLGPTVTRTVVSRIASAGTVITFPAYRDSTGETNVTISDPSGGGTGTIYVSINYITA